MYYVRRLRRDVIVSASYKFFQTKEFLVGTIDKEVRLKRLAGIGILVLSLVGCALTQENTPLDLSAMTHQFISLELVHPGMTPSEVAAVLGQQVIVGYELVDAKVGQFKPIVINNPYRRETIGKYDVAYYFVGIKKADDQITDDELVPLIFQNGRLTAYGWPFLETKVKKPATPASPSKP